MGCEPSGLGLLVVKEICHGADAVTKGLDCSMGRTALPPRSVTDPS